MAQPTTPRKTRRTRRRSPREGSVYPITRRRRDGTLLERWRGAVTWTRPDGSRARRTVTAATSEAARDELDKLRRELRLGTLVAAGPGDTVGDYLEAWLGRHREHVRPSSWGVAESYVRVYLIPALGRHSLTRLSAADVERALASFVRDGRTGRPGHPIAPITAAHVRATLRTALSAAVRDGVLGRNVARDAKPPQVPHRPVTYLGAPDVRRLLAATASDPLGPLYALAATTGLRRGELLALRWFDVADGSLTVRRAVSRDAAGGWRPAETKSARSRRTIPLPASARAALERQRERQERDRSLAGTRWRNVDELVFTDAGGGPLLPEFVSHAFARARRDSGVPPVRFHDLRHSAATMMLAEGVPLAVISEWLGHAGIAVTAAHYAAVVPALRREAADAMDRALGSDG
jgi:integrase